MGRDDLKKCMRAAVIGHLRSWLAEDGTNHRRILCDKNRKTDPATLKRIAIDYFVVRGFPKKKNNNSLEPWCQVAKLIDGKICEWPETLCNRAKFVQCLAEEAKNKDLTRSLQLSAFSKFLWFLRPKSWAPYDKWASTGLAKAVPGRTRLRFDAYYKELETLDFIGVTNTMREEIAKTRFNALWPERIVDKYLMRCGQQARDASSIRPASFIPPEEHEDYLEVLYGLTGCNFSGELDSLTNSLLEIIPKELRAAVR